MRLEGSWRALCLPSVSLSLSLTHTPCVHTSLIPSPSGQLQVLVEDLEQLRDTHGRTSELYAQLQESHAFLVSGRDQLAAEHESLRAQHRKLVPEHEVRGHEVEGARGSWKGRREGGMEGARAYNTHFFQWMHAIFLIILSDGCVLAYLVPLHFLLPPRKLLGSCQPPSLICPGSEAPQRSYPRNWRPAGLLWRSRRMRGLPQR